MKKLGTLTLTLVLLAAASANAAETAEETKDQVAGGMTGMMIGAVGGPIGALFGPIGAMFGGESRGGKVIRSPNREFAVGDKVETRGSRMYDAAALSENRTGGSDRD